ncbi:6-phospho-3-hexuloisomerase [Rathayibacter sp. AY1E9]|uniref:6-phospho-3-hexuloisomerase n=1 Tax=unclassified Rathayibacter TaxID=2609250 RepID=UPI000CE75530|nr:MULTISPECIES: 6-phospho-3-hexuloisomerase [unclassified Rathayibacter]PPG53575.1 6-phospho-3-hexuloisomerase [Rathayibacter sp. AY1E9]PPG56583.1 6-phospho-3-hexuloisomerase [Rathayibacter sp. AY1C5]
MNDSTAQLEAGEARPGERDGAIALRELESAVGSVSDADLDRIAARILETRTVVCGGAGREGLMMRALVMRLFHAGISAHVVGDMTCPAVGEGDLAILSLGPGRLRTIETLARIAHEAGARTMCLTAQPELVPDGMFDDLVVVEAQTMASDSGSASVLPMGSAFEIAQLILVDLITNRVRAGLAESLGDMRARHTNLE